MLTSSSCLGGDMRTQLTADLVDSWGMCGEKLLTTSGPLEFLGPELERMSDGPIRVHQRTFIQELRTKHRYLDASGIDHLSTEAVPEQAAPTPAVLKTLQS